MENLEELRRLAEQAGSVKPGTRVNAAQALEYRKAWDDYRAAANPATILSLLDELAGLRGEKETWTRLTADAQDGWEAANQRVTALEKGLRAILEAWDKRATAKHSEQIIALIPAILQARSLLQSSAASQGDEK